MSITEPTKKVVPGCMKFVIGGSAGMMAICVVQPMDLTKTRMQLMGSSGWDRFAAAAKRSVFSDVSEIIQKEGIGGMYKGLTAALFKQATYTTARLGIFNYSFDMYKERFGTPGFGGKLLLGVMAGAIGAFVGNPAEVCLIRMTADGRLPPDQRRNYTNVFNALVRYTSDSN